MNHERFVIIASLLAGVTGAGAQANPDQELQSTAQAMLASGPTCGQASRFGGAERRLLQKAAQGVDALRDYVYITRGIHPYNMTEIGTWIDLWHAESAHCSDLALVHQGQH